MNICKYLNTYKYFQVLLSTESKLGGVQITYFNMSKFCADANFNCVTGKLVFAHFYILHIRCKKKVPIMYIM